MVTAYELALERVSNGADGKVVAAELVASMTLEEKVHCHDGAVPFWVGIKDITTGG